MVHHHSDEGTIKCARPQFLAHPLDSATDKTAYIRIPDGLVRPEPAVPEASRPSLVMHGTHCPIQNGGGGQFCPEFSGTREQFQI